MQHASVICVSVRSVKTNYKITNSISKKSVYIKKQKQLMALFKHGECAMFMQVPSEYQLDQQ